MLAINSSCIDSFQCIGNAVCAQTTYTCSCSTGYYFDVTLGVCSMLEL